MAYFAIVIRICLLAVLIFVFVKIRQSVMGQPLMRLKKKVWTAHLVSLLVYIALWIAYEISYIFWIKDT